MPELQLLLMPVRTLKQGTGLNLGKDSPEYRDAVTTLDMNEADMARLGVADGAAVCLSNPVGEVQVRCRRAELPAGLACIAYGPASSVLLGTETGASGMPASKHIAVQARAAAGGGPYAS